MQRLPEPAQIRVFWLVFQDTVRKVQNDSKSPPSPEINLGVDLKKLEILGRTAYFEP